MNTDERPVGDPFGYFDDARTAEQVNYAASAALSFLIGYINNGDSLEDPAGRTRLVTQVAAINAERRVAYARILGRAE